MLKIYARCLLVLLLGANCASFKASLQIQALQREQSAARPLAVGGVLHSGDQFLLQIEVEKPAYIYVLQAAQLQPQRIFPNGPASQVPPNIPFYIPGAGQYYTLDDKTGQETFIVIASVLPQSDEQLLELARQQDGLVTRDVRSRVTTSADEKNKNKDTGTKEELPRPRMPTPITKPGFRHVIEARFDGRQIAVLRFTFKHQPRK